MPKPNGIFNMRYEGKVVNLNNYKTAVPDRSMDFYDELFLALLYRTDMSKHLNNKMMSDEDFRQIRLAKREGIPEMFLNTGAGNLAKLRKVWHKGLNLDTYKFWINKQGVSREVLSVILDWTIKGYPISKVDFRVLNLNLVQYYSKMLSLGKDIKPYMPNYPITLETLKLLDTIGHPEVVSLQLNPEILRVLVKFPDLVFKVDTINRNVQPDTLESLGHLIKRHPKVTTPEFLEDLTKIDEEGRFYIQQHQVDFLESALQYTQNRTKLIPLFNPETSYEECRQLVLDLKIEAGNKINRTLRPNHNH